MIWIYGVCFLLAIVKWADIGYLQNLSWGWVLLPLVVAILWFEVFERLFGMDRARTLKDAQFERAKKERIAKQLQRRPPGQR